MISTELLQSITLGALEIRREGDFYSFHRFTQLQEENYAKRRYLSRAQSAACIKLEFYTKGGEVSFAYEIAPGNARQYYGIDLLVDGIYRHSVSEDTNTASGTFFYRIPTSGETQRITVYFPTTAVIRIRDLVLPEDITPHRRTLKLLMLGDSMCQGYNPNHFQNTCTNVLADGLDAWMLNQSVGGECFRADNLDKLEFDPDYILVSYGINDWASGRLKNGEDAAEYFARLVTLYPEKPIFAMLPPDIDYLEQTRRNDDLIYNADRKSSGRQTFEDVRQILLRVIAPYANITPINCKNFIPQYPECFYQDHIHLTDLGNRILGDALLHALRGLILK